MKLWFIILILIPSFGFSQEKLKFRGKGDNGTIAIVISNSSPIYPYISDIENQLTAQSFRVAVAKKDVDISSVSLENSPFAKDVTHVLKIYVHNKSARETVLKLTIELLDIATQKKSSKELSLSQSSINLFYPNIKSLLNDIIPKKAPEESYKITEIIEPGVFVFEKKPGILLGDEIFIQYSTPRGSVYESPAIVTKITETSITAKDHFKYAEQNDLIKSLAPKRNRFGLSMSLMVPTLGENSLSLLHNTFVYSDVKRWPVGFKISGEYERLLPYNLVSTTSFGIAVDRIFNTELFTGVGYRIFYQHWEFQPYLRIGGQYTPISLNSDQSQIQGFALRFGLNLGMAFSYRISQDMFLGLDLGVTWLPLEYVTLIEGTKALKSISWQNSKNLPLSELYPYLGIKVGWLF